MIEIYGGQFLRPQSPLLIASSLTTNLESHLPRWRISPKWLRALAADARWEGSDPSSSRAFSDRAQTEVGGRWCFRCPAASELSYFWPAGPRHASKVFKVAIAISLGGHAAITQSLISGREL